MTMQASRRPTAGVILAAGMSTRFGRTKQLLSMEGRSLVARITAAALASRLDRTVLVLGHQAGPIARQLGALRDDSKLSLVINDLYAEGMSSSIRAGVAAVRQSCRSVMMLLADLPLIDQSLIDWMLEAFYTGDKPICLPVRDGRGGHPVCLDAAYFDDLMTLDGDQGARDIIRRNPSAVNRIECDDDGCFFDIDTPQDLIQFKQTR